MRYARALVSLIVGLPALVAAQPHDSLSQQGRHLLAGGIGVSGSREASVGAGQTDARADGASASLTYARYMSPAVAIEISAAMLDASASASYSGANSSAVSAFLLGVRFSPTQLALTPSIRPFVSAVVGPYVHSASRASGGASVGASMQSRVGGRLGAGAVFHVARHFALFFEGDYHAVDGFDAVNGSAPDPSGASLILGLGLTWGR